MVGGSGGGWGGLGRGMGSIVRSTGGARRRETWLHSLAFVWRWVRDARSRGRERMLAESAHLAKRTAAGLRQSHRTPRGCWGRAGSASHRLGPRVPPR